MSRVELKEDVLDLIAGGSIDYHPNKAGSLDGTIGINGNYTHVYDNENDVLAYYGAHYQDQQWTSREERDNYLFNGMIAAGIIH